ncbi:MAG: lamin tail domain-containing protein [bacterium]|nr:lamin tail domain-containing protein [bacterium]
MKAFKSAAIALTALLALVACGCDMDQATNPPPPGGGDLVVNEFMASNATQGMDEHGEYDDWIELYNRGDAAIDLAGYSVTDNLGDHQKFTIEAGSPTVTTIQPGGFLMIWCDSQTDQGPLHASFNLSAGGEDIGIYEPNGDAVAEFTYGAQSSDVSYGRTTDGGPVWALFSAPTPGASNDGGGQNTDPVIATPVLDPAAPAAGQTVLVTAEVTDDGTVEAVALFYAVDGGAFTEVAMSLPVAASQAGDAWGGYIPAQSAGAVVTYYLRAVDDEENVTLLPAGAPATNLTYTVAGGGAVPELYINEYLASNDSGNTDPFGDFEDWIEIYNAGATAVDLGGMYVTDDLGQPTKYLIPATDAAATTVPAGGFLILWADNEPEEGATHIVPKLSGGGEAIGLYTAALDPIDTRTFGPQTADVSEGRATDGGDVWTTFTTPTPGASNGTPGK